MDLRQARRLVANAFYGGGQRKSLVVTEWDVSGNCREPVLRELHARPSPGHRAPVIPGGERWSLDQTFDQDISPSAGEIVETRRKAHSKYVTVRPGGDLPVTLRLTVRCRRCDPCRNLRRRMWAARAQAETRGAERTWFGTLTIAPQVHHVHLARARQRLARQGVVYEDLSYGEQFTELHKQSGREVQLMLKRLRKATKAPFVYLCVAEAHKSGLPHYHLLIHEQDATQPIRKAQLDAEWRIGFCKWRLVNDLKEATYLCKYLSKSTAARVRASVRYGERSEQENALEAQPQRGVSSLARTAGDAREDDTLGAREGGQGGDNPPSREAAVWKQVMRDEQCLIDPAGGNDGRRSLSED